MAEIIHAITPSTRAEETFVRRVYNWMAAGLGVSALVSLFMLNNEALLITYFSTPLRFILPIGELILVFWMFGRIGRMSSAQATGLFFFYAALNGVTLTPILIQYTKASIFTTFCVTGATFGVTSMYAWATKKNLSSIGGFVLMGMIGLIVASLINIFLQSPAIYWILTYAGVALSIAVTAYYTQAIRAMAHGQYENHRMEANGPIMGALMLYVAFVMMFVYLLRILGDRR